MLLLLPAIHLKKKGEPRFLHDLFASSDGDDENDVCGTSFRVVRFGSRRRKVAIRSNGLGNLPPLRWAPPDSYSRKGRRKRQPSFLSSSSLRARPDAEGGRICFPLLLLIIFAPVREGQKKRERERDHLTFPNLHCSHFFLYSSPPLKIAYQRRKKSIGFSPYYITTRLS